MFIASVGRSNPAGLDTQDGAAWQRMVCLSDVDVFQYKCEARELEVYKHSNAQQHVHKWRKW